jgi:hypothetical protein
LSDHGIIAILRSRSLVSALHELQTPGTARATHEPIALP